MAPLDLKIGISFLFQIVIGILGNFSLFYYCTFYFNGCRSWSKNLIISHISVANSLVIFSRGIPQAMEAFGLKQSFNYFECKLVLFVHRVSRSVSIGTTCLLSIFQSITISFINSRWKELKLKVLKSTGPSNLFCWILHIILNSIFPLYQTGKWSNRNSTENNDLGYCNVPLNEKVSESLYAALLSIHDVTCLGLMLWTSGSMVFILCRHKQCVQNIHKNHLSLRPSTESKATQNILVLVITFVSFYSLFSISNVYVALFKNHNWWLLNYSALIIACFQTVRPFILMGNDFIVYRFCCICCGRNTKFLHLIRNI